jgi:hypothetical protein
MQFTTIALTIAAAVLPATYAADCAGAKWGKPDMALFWTAREVACMGSNKSYNDARVQISFNGAGTPDAQLCWDATENILNQCITEGMDFWV